MTTCTGRAVLVGLGLVKRYGAHTALDGIDVSIGEGEVVAITGPSGSGKTTLLHVLAGITTPDEGKVLLRDRRIDDGNEDARSRLRRNVFGFVFQSGQLLAELPADENVALPLMFDGVARDEAVTRARAWFAPLGLDGLESRRPGQLSGGQAQRVAIARALVGDPAVVFADEPTGALDQATGRSIMQTLTSVVATRRTTLVVVTHESAVADRCSRVIGVRDGQLTHVR